MFICSATLFKSFRQALSIDVAEHWAIMKNTRICHNLSFALKIGIAFSLKRVLFYCSSYNKRNQ